MISTRLILRPPSRVRTVPRRCLPCTAARSSSSICARRTRSSLVAEVEDRRARAVQQPRRPRTARTQLSSQSCRYMPAESAHRLGAAASARSADCCARPAMLTWPPRVITTVPSTRRARSASESASATSGCPASTSDRVPARRRLAPRARPRARELAGNVSSHGMQQQPAHRRVLEQRGQARRPRRPARGRARARQTARPALAPHSSASRSLAPGEVVVARLGRRGDERGRGRRCRAAASNSASVRPPP